MQTGRLKTSDVRLKNETQGWGRETLNLRLSLHEVLV